MAYVPGVYKNNGVGCLSQNDNESVQLSEEGLILKTNLLTTPIIVQVGTNGLSTTNPTGLEVISPLNMTGNNITNVDTITYPDNTQFTIQNPLAVGQGEFKIYSDSNNPPGSSAVLNAETININTGGIYIGGTLNMSGQNIEGVNALYADTIYTTNLNANPNIGSILNVNCDTNFNNFDIDSVDNINLNTINGLSPTTIGLIWNDFDANNAWTNLPNNQYALNNYLGSVSSLSVNSLSITNANTTTNYTFGVSGNDLRINPNGDRLLMGDTAESYWGDFSIGTNSTIGLNVGGACKIDLNSRGGLLIAGDTDLAVNKTTIIINDVHREIDLNAVDILSNVGSSIYYTLPINFTMKWTGNYNYSLNNNWEMVQHNQMNLPVEYFTLTGAQTAWRYEFAINCYNCNNQTDKAYAMYLEFVDSNSNAFQSFCFNYNTPFTTHKNNSTYSATSNSIENYCYTDHIDFTGSSGGPFDIRLWRYGDNNYNCDFNAILTLSKTNLV